MSRHRAAVEHQMTIDGKVSVELVVVITPVDGMMSSPSLQMTRTVELPFIPHVGLEICIYEQGYEYSFACHELVYLFHERRFLAHERTKTHVDNCDDEVELLTRLGWERD